MKVLYLKVKQLKGEDSVKVLVAGLKHAIPTVKRSLGAGGAGGDGKTFWYDFRIVEA